MSINTILSRIENIDQKFNSLTNKTELDIKKTDTSLIPSFSQILNQTRNNLPPRANKWIVEDAIKQASIKTGIDADLLRAIIQQESGGNINAVSGAGAKGLMQLMDDTAKELGVTDPFDPHQNVLAGAKYLKQNLQRFQDIKLALAAYNAGPARVAQYNGIPPFPETQNYINNIGIIYSNLKKNNS